MLGIPLGIGKPNRLVNALYRRARENPSIQLRIVTALTPSVPTGATLLEKRFVGPLAERLYAGYVPLDYLADVARDALPPNIEISEFYFSPGAWLGSHYAQRQHVSANYSHVTRLLIDRGINVVAQSIASRKEGGEVRYSLGSNPDLTLDLARKTEAESRPYLLGVVTKTMPFMPNDAETPAGFWDAIVDEGEAAPEVPLFAVPAEPVALVDYAIATHVTSLIEDGGTLQIGIGSLGDAIAHVIGMRQTDNQAYRTLCECLIGERERSLRAALPVELEPFASGLYASSEMLVEGFLNLIEAGVIRRPVRAVSDPDRQVLLHAAFFLGSAGFYRRLRELPEDLRQAIEMTGVRFVNTLDDDWAGKAAQRTAARFVNSAMMVTLDGAVVSDAIAGKRVVSGVGGQHDFVGMAQHLPGARSLIMLPSTRTKNGRTRSNIVFEYPHTTIPRQFRDIVVTEYGAADLRGKSDRDVMLALIAIADARFQTALLTQAQQAGKIETGFRPPDSWRGNTRDRLEGLLTGRMETYLPHYPLGTDFTPEEARLAVALDYLKPLAGSKLALARLLLGAGRPSEPVAPLLERMGLAPARGLGERLARRALLAALARTESRRPL